VALSGPERRALREIEELLAAEDPALAGLLRRGGVSRRERVTRWTSRVVVTLAVALLLFGLFLSDAGMVSIGLLMLVALPPGLWLAAIVLGGSD
jgi:hypothetical protein